MIMNDSITAKLGSFRRHKQARMKGNFVERVLGHIRIDEVGGFYYEDIWVHILRKKVALLLYH